MASNPFNTGVFSAPKYSSFPWSHGNRISMDAGKIHVIGSEYLDTGEKFDLNSIGNVTRVAPMKAPTLDTYQTDIFAFACRLRTLGMATRNPWPYEDFFNLRDNIDTSKRLPDIPLAVLFGVNRFRNNTLLENFGLPTFKNLREDYLSFLRSGVPSVFSPIFELDEFGWFSVDSLPRDFQLVSDGFSFHGNQYFYNFGLVNLPFSLSLVSWAFSQSSFRGSLVSSFVTDPQNVFVDVAPLGGVFTDFGSLTRVGVLNILDIIFDVCKVDALSVLKEYEDYLLDSLWEMRSYQYVGNDISGLCNVLDIYPDSIGGTIIQTLEHNFPDLPKQNLQFVAGVQISCPMVPTYFFDAYNKIVADWFINTALVDPDDFYINASKLFHPRAANGTEVNWTTIFNASGSSTQQQEYKTVIRNYKQNNGFHYRYWKNDYFTSCFPTAQAGSAVQIPINGTIVDFRNANSWQKLKERLLYAGHRMRDVLFALTGKKTSSAIMDMSEVLGAWSNTINVDSVLQQSESTNGQPLANYAGTGLGYRSGGKGAYYVAEEPTVIIFVASIRPQASYFQGLHRKFTRGFITDYDIPQLANIGEDVVYTSELYFDGDSAKPKTREEAIFGYQRRYGSFMWCPDEVHGDFRGNLDFWHNSRIFGSEPSLSLEFMQVKPDEDNLNRIFAVTSDSVNHFYAHFTFIGSVIRHLPKSALYEL